jgi:hypothetical protein
MWSAKAKKVSSNSGPDLGHLATEHRIWKKAPQLIQAEALLLSRTSC